MINEEKLIEALKHRMALHEQDAEAFKDSNTMYDTEEMILRLADECQAIIELVEDFPKSEQNK